MKRLLRFESAYSQVVCEYSDFLTIVKIITH